MTFARHQAWGWGRQADDSAKLPWPELFVDFRPYRTIASSLSVLILHSTRLRPRRSSVLGAFI